MSRFRALAAASSAVPAGSIRWIAALLSLSLTTMGSTAQEPGSWASEVVVAAPTVLCGCAVGEILPDRRGREIVAVGEDGSVHVAFRVDGQWRSERIHRAAGALIQVAIGDVLPDVDGDEIVAVGMAEGPEKDDAPGVAIVLHRTRKGWKATTMFRSPALVHGVCVFERSVIVTGYDRAVHRLRRDGTTWGSERLAGLSGPGKTAVVVGGAIVVACKDGALVRVESAEGRWRSRTIDRRDSGRARLGAHGTRVVVADDDGTVSLVDGVKGTAERVFRDEKKSRGAVLADLLPNQPGLEVATGGYSKRVTLLRKQGDRWRAQTLFEDTASLHHLVAAELDERPGAELVACGYSGRLVVLRRADAADATR